MFRVATVEVQAGDDSNLTQQTFNRKATFTQTLDLESCAPTLRVGTADADTQISLAPVTTGYFIAVFSDYPIRLRLNGAAETQFTMRPNNVAAVNVGAPLPAKCCFLATVAVTALYVQPIASATQAANVWVLCTGDPTNAYSA